MTLSPTAEAALDGTAVRPLAPRFAADDFFDQQPTPSASLPDPRPLVENLTRCVIEILAGARELDQIARWLTDDVYRHLLKRKVQSGIQRIPRLERPLRPNFRFGTVIVCEPSDGVVEAVAVLHGKSRSRAVTIRLEGFDRRWRATAIRIL